MQVRTHKPWKNLFGLAALGVALSTFVAAPAPVQAQFGSISEREEIEAGEEVVRAAIKEYGRPVSSSDPRQQRVSRIAQRLLPYVERRNIPYSFTVLNNDRVLNAFAAPGGPVMVTTRLVDVAETDAELAFVLAHEIGHIEEKHAVNQAKRQSQIGLGAAILGALLGGGGSSDLIGTVAGVGLSLYQSGYSRSQERESDDEGVNLMVKAGFDPRAAVTMLGKLGSNRGGISKYLASHPNPQERQGRVQEQIREKNLVSAASRAAGGNAITNLSGSYGGSYAPALNDNSSIYPTGGDNDNRYIQLRVVQSGNYRVVLAPVNEIKDFAGGDLRYRNGEVTVARGGASATFIDRSHRAILNGRRISMSAPAQIIDGRFYAPLGTLAEGLNGRATYDGSRGQIRLDFGGGRNATIALR